MQGNVAFRIRDQRIRPAFQQIPDWIEMSKKLVCGENEDLTLRLASLFSFTRVCIYGLLDGSFVFVFTGPDQRCPASLILEIQKLSGEVRLTKDHVATFQMTTLSGKVQTGHSVVSFEGEICSGLHEERKKESFNILTEPAQLKKEDI